MTESEMRARWSTIQAGLALASSSHVQDSLERLLNGHPNRDSFYEALPSVIYASDSVGLARAGTALEFALGRIQTNNVKVQYEIWAAKSKDRAKAQVRETAADLMKMLQPAASTTAEVPVTTVDLGIVVPEEINADNIRKPSVVVPARTEKTMLELIRDFDKRKLRNIRETMPVPAPSTKAKVRFEDTQIYTAGIAKLGSVVNGIMDEFSALQLKNLKNLTRLAESVDRAYAEFEVVYEVAGAALNTKVAIAKALFTAAANSGIFPLNVVGKVGALAVGMAHADTKVAQTDFEREPGMPASSTLGRVVAYAEGKLEAVQDATNIGIPAKSLASKSAIKDLMETVVDKTNEKICAEVRDLLRDTLGVGRSPEVGYNLIRNMVSDQVALGLSGSMLTTKMEEELDRIKSDLVDGLKRMFAARVYRTDELSRWIELDMWSRYFAEVFDPSISDLSKRYDKSVPDAVIKRLYQLEIVQPKGKDNYAAVIAKGRLPWEGHPVHKVGLGLFFEWYGTVQPFRMVAHGGNRLTPEVLQNKVDEYITAIGTAINSSKTRGFLSRRTTIENYAAVSAAQSSQLRSALQ